MNTLTKIYRLVWNEDKKLNSDPYIEYFTNSITYTNSINFFESDNIEEIENKINELNLIYQEDLDENSPEDI